MTAGAPFRITGWGLAAPARVVTNADLERTLDTSDEWIRTRSGIAERRWTRPHETTAGLAVEAATAALKSAGRTPAELGLVLIATCTPDQQIPQTAAAVCEGLGVTCGSFDVHGACAGFVQALIAGGGMVAASPGPVLVVGAERLTSVTDPTDRTTAVLLADGAGALVLEPDDDSGAGLLGWDAGTDGAARPYLEIPEGQRFLHMDGGEVFRRAVRVVVESTTTALERAGLTVDDVALFVPHQANARIIEAARGRLGIPEDRTCVNVDRWGNTSAASIPIALAEAATAGRISPGDVVLLSGFGAGMTWASAAVRWS
ncbi:MAG: 3-oxoacyl-ACP synthase III family protein [Acidimicrobiales bacterium]